jgi:omega-amidase
MRPDGTFVHYDKRHLFRMAGENETFAAGFRRLVIELKGWRFCPLICYDLRFPVWSRNRSDYDALVFIANWPEPRSRAWKSLLPARAIENQAYVIAVNRIGTDGNGRAYSGDSGVYDPRGMLLSRIRPHEEIIETLTLSGRDLVDFRKNFQVALDADSFKIN